MIVLTTGLSAATAVPATASHDPAKVWVGGTPPDASWTFKPAGSTVHQEASGTPLEAHCADDCTVVQINTTGNNFAECDQSSETNGDSLVCNIDQTNTSGENRADYSQSIELTTSGQLADVDQSGTMSVVIDQDNGSGANKVGSSVTPSTQSTSAMATSLDVPFAVHDQTARQVASVDQFSDTGNQDAFVDQSITLNSLTQAVGNATQNQLTDVGSDKHQRVHLNIVTTGGVNAVQVDQAQDLDENATGAVTSANQKQGAPAAAGGSGAALDWFVDSKNSSFVDADQSKDWFQNAEILPPPVGTWTHEQQDGLDILGKLPSTHDAQTSQFAQLTPGGICRQDLVLFTKILGIADQNCTYPATGQAFTQHHEDEDFELHQECNPSTCPKQETVVTQPAEVLGSQGLGDGYWKTHLASWPPTDLDPNQRVDSIFAMPARFSDLADDSLFKALNYPNASGLRGAALRLVKKAVSGVLNAKHPGVDYPLHSTVVSSRTGDELANGTAAEIHELATELEGYNQLGCTSAPGDTTQCPPP